VAREPAAELYFVAEGAHLAFVFGKHPENERLGRGPEQIEVRRHAGAEIQHHHYLERLRLVLEECDFLWLPVVEDRELLLFEVRDEPPLRVDDGGKDSDD